MDVWGLWTTYKCRVHETSGVYEDQRWMSRVLGSLWTSGTHADNLWLLGVCGDQLDSHGAWGPSVKSGKLGDYRCTSGVCGDRLKYLRCTGLGEMLRVCVDIWGV